MEVVIVSWGLRLTLIAAIAVTAASVGSGASLIDAVTRGVAAALVFTFATRWLLDRMESPERRLRRLRAERQKERERSGRGGKGKGRAAAAAEADADGRAAQPGANAPGRGGAPGAARKAA